MNSNFNILLVFYGGGWVLVIAETEIYCTWGITVGVAEIDDVGVRLPLGFLTTATSQGRYYFESQDFRDGRFFLNSKYVN